MESRMLLLGTAILQVALLIKLVLLFVSYIRSDRYVLRSALVQCRRAFQMPSSKDSQSELEVDKKRCRWTRSLWWMVLLFSMLRLMARQVRWLRFGQTNHPEAQGLDQTGPGSDLVSLIMASLSLLIAFFPSWINPKSQDFWYVLTTLSLSVGYLIPENMEVADMVGYTSAGLFVYAVLAKRTWCAALCTTINLLTAMRLSRNQTDAPPAAYAAATLPFTYSVSFVGIIAVRRLLCENVLLKLDLQKRSVELGAVSSLLTACYDAVFELDNSLRLTDDSSQLSAMLLYAPRAGGLSGRPLQDFFSENDRARISEQVLRSTNENVSAVAFNADMLDSDFNHVKVELFCAQFKNLAEEQCFLVGVREIQEEPRAQASIVSKPSAFISQDKEFDRDQFEKQFPENPQTSDLSVIYDVFTFEVHLMSREMEKLWKGHHGDVMPDSILELACDASRSDLSNQLQTLANQFASQRAKDVSVKFNFLGRGDVTGLVSVEHDELLDSWVGTMLLHNSISSLTESNLQNLAATAGHGFSFYVHRSSRSRSSSGRSRSRRSRNSNRSSRRSSLRMGSPSNVAASGVISQLRDRIQL